MNSRHDAPVQASRGVRVALAYFVVVGVLFFVLFAASVMRILLDESLRRGEILIGNVNIIMAGVLVPALLLLAAKQVRNGSRHSTGLAVLAFVLLALWVPRMGPSGVVIGVVILVGLALSVIAWRGATTLGRGAAPGRGG